MTDFILDSAVERAERVLADRRWFIATDAQWDVENRIHCGCEIVAGHGRPAGRLTERGRPAAIREPNRHALVCGSADLAESASRMQVDAGVDPQHVRVERLGPSDRR